MKVFWSWQNDFNPKVCRHLIREALIDATDLAAEELGLEDAERPEVDHDTKGTPGMAEIAATILDKIAKSAVFVADVTPIGKTEAGKALPNPNVLIELGWAMGTIGPERIICVLNIASGFKADDLPFDIRHRRIMTYDTASDSDKKTRLEAKKRLASDLFEALRANLALHLNASAASKQIKGMAANPSDPSIWATATATLEYTDPFDPGPKKSVPFPSLPRAYIRIIPAQWKDGPPAVSDIRELRDQLALWPVGFGSMDYGFCEEGFIRFSLGQMEGAYEKGVRNAVMYFDSTGEFWAIQSSAVGLANRGPSLRHEQVLKFWAEAMQKTFAAFQKFGAAADWRVEMGIVRLNGVRWFGQWDSESPVARKPGFSIDRQLRGWDETVLSKLMVDAFSAINDLFGRPRATFDDVKPMLPQGWGENPVKPFTTSFLP